MMNDRILLMGCPIDRLDMAQTINKVEECIKEKRLCQHVVVNVAKFVDMQNDEALRGIINSCDIINADGMPLIWASKLMRTPLPCRVAGVDLFQELIAFCAKNRYRPFFFGAREEVVLKVIEVFKEKYPKLRIAGYRNGYYEKLDEKVIANQIKESNADMLFIGFSSPKKEKFLNKWKNYMGVPFCMGVGGSFDIVAGKTIRAPNWMQKIGLEWLFRIYQEPKRMWKRYASTNPVFVWMVLKELIKKYGT